MKDIIREVESIYNSFGNSLVIKRGELDPSNEKDPFILGYCHRYEDIYSVYYCDSGDKKLDEIIRMHEYGHIYLGHLEGIYDQLNENLLNIIRNRDKQLIDLINNNCGIDYADKVLEKVQNDKFFNHYIHNIAMDMEINSSILDVDDLAYVTESVNTIAYSKFMSLVYEGKLTINKLASLVSKTDIKSVHPSSYGFTPGLTYPDYLMLLIMNLDKLVRKTSNLVNGNKKSDRNSMNIGEGSCDASSSDSSNGLGSGSSSGNSSNKSGKSENSDKNESNDSNNPDNSNIPKTKEEFEEMVRNLRDIMNSFNDDSGKNGGNESEESDKSDKSGKSDKSDKSNESGESNESDESGKDSEDSGDKDENSDDSVDDHGTQERDSSWKKHISRSEAEAMSGGQGRGLDRSTTTRDYIVNTDPLILALEEIIRKVRHKVIKRDFAKDVVYKYNRRILGDSKIISPTYKLKMTKSENPTVLFVVDVSGSMDADLVDRIITSIRNGMYRIDRSLTYNLVTWDTELCEYYKDISLNSPIPRISCGGGTALAGSFDLFKRDFDKNAIMILISDFGDSLDDWHERESKMNGYSMYGFRYGRYYGSSEPKWKNFKVRVINENR